MIEQVGKIKEIFIPCNREDILQSLQIGFIVETNDGLKTIIQDQNDINCDYLVGDMVQIINRTVDGREFIDIKEYDGDVNE